LFIPFQKYVNNIRNVQETNAVEIKNFHFRRHNSFGYHLHAIMKWNRRNASINKVCAIIVWCMCKSTQNLRSAKKCCETFIESVSALGILIERSIWVTKIESFKWF